MKLSTYSSLAAFLAHYRALESAIAGHGRALADEERAALAAMARLVSAALDESERVALGLIQIVDAPAHGAIAGVPLSGSSPAEPGRAGAAAGLAARRRARAELKLRRALIANSILAG